MKYAKIISTGRYVPARVVNNNEMEQIVGEPVNDWLVANTGIQARHFMADNEVTSDLCTYAAKNALDKAGISPLDIDLIIVSTDTPDYISPSTAAITQYKLGAKNAGAFDINSACAGFNIALDMASNTIAINTHIRYILVIGVYGMSRFLEWTDKKMSTIFADGAGAVLVAADTVPGYIGGQVLNFGEYNDAIGIFTGGTALPATSERILNEGKPIVRYGASKFPPSFNTDIWPLILNKLGSRLNIKLDDVDLFIFTQYNLRTIEAMMRILNQPIEKTHWTMNKWGYTGSACIPQTLDDAVESGKLSSGKLVALCASGGGISVAASFLRWI